MLEMKIKVEADAAVLKAIDKLTTALEKNAVNTVSYTHLTLPTIA